MMNSRLEIESRETTLAGTAQRPLAGSETCDGEPRINGPFPARAHGTDARGLRFKSDTVLENLSARDFQVRLSEPVEPGEKLFVVTRINQAIVVLRAKISSILRRDDGSFCAAASIMRYRFLHRRTNSN